MSKGVKRVLGVVAAVAVPFLAPAVAGVLGVTSTLGTSLVGAGLGAASAAATGQNPLLGAALGGVGTFGLQGGFGSLFGGTTAATTGATGAAPAAGATGAGLAVPTAATAAPVAPAVAAAPAAATAAAAPVSFGGALKSTLASLASPQSLARITLLAAAQNPNLDGLSAEERALIGQRKTELARLASTDRRLLDEQVAAAHGLLQQAAQQAPNPEQAFARTKIATERQLADSTRGLSAPETAFAQRRAGIRSSQTGATAAAADYARGSAAQANLTQAGLNALPQNAPEGVAGRLLPLYNDLAARRRQAQHDFVQSAGLVAPSLFGSIA